MPASHVGHEQNWPVCIVHGTGSYVGCSQPETPLSHNTNTYCFCRCSLNATHPYECRGTCFSVPCTLAATLAPAPNITAPALRLLVPGSASLAGATTGNRTSYLAYNVVRGCVAVSVGPSMAPHAVYTHAWLTGCACTHTLSLTHALTPFLTHSRRSPRSPLPPPWPRAPTPPPWPTVPLWPLTPRTGTCRPPSPHWTSRPVPPPLAA